MMIFLSVIVVVLCLAAIVIMTYAHLRIFNRPYLGKEFSAQPNVVTSMKPRFIFVKHLEPRHWWETWLESPFVRAFSKESPECRERIVYANLYVPDNVSTTYPLVVYTHGNGATIEEAAAWLEPLVAAGFALLVCEYRGYGESGGNPERSLINKDLCFFYDEALRTGLIDENNITFYGRSLGGGVACDLSFQRSAQKLILESTYFKLFEILGTKHLPDYVLLGKDFECAAAVDVFKGKILICHGDNDTVSPVEQAQKLHALKPSSILKIFKATHSNIYQKAEYNEYILNWLRNN